MIKSWRVGKGLREVILDRVSMDEVWDSKGVRRVRNLVKEYKGLPKRRERKKGMKTVGRECR